jgi:hypothetical protein
MVRDEITPSALAAWRHRVLCSVRVQDQSHVDRIAEACASRELCGDRYVNVWHEAALFYGTKCHCCQCGG